MKITKLLAIMLFFIAASLHSQEIANHAFGLRLGESDGFGAEFSYQKSIGRYSRIELNAGYRDSREFDAVKGTLLFHKVFPIGRVFNWYYGFGGGVGSVNFEPIPNSDNPNLIEDPEGGLFVLAAGDIGIEANFNIPLVISLDIRPELGLFGYDNFDNNFEFDVAIGIRYQF